MERELYKMTYRNKKITKKYKLNILGYNFVLNNRNKGKFIYNNKKYSLKEQMSINGIKSEKIKIKLILDKYCPNKSFMFAYCNSLLSVSIRKAIFKNKFDFLIKQKQILNENEIYTELSNYFNTYDYNTITSYFSISEIDSYNDNFEENLTNKFEEVLNFSEEPDKNNIISIMNKNNSFCIYK